MSSCAQTKETVYLYLHASVHLFPVRFHLICVSRELHRAHSSCLGTPMIKFKHPLGQCLLPFQSPCFISKSFHIKATPGRVLWVCLSWLVEGQRCSLFLTLSPRYCVCFLLSVCCWWPCTSIAQVYTLVRFHWWSCDHVTVLTINSWVTNHLVSMWYRYHFLFWASIHSPYPHPFEVTCGQSCWPSILPSFGVDASTRWLSRCDLWVTKRLSVRWADNFLQKKILLRLQRD